ncbi:MAG: carbohydrate ABC transporter permease [Treponema sp.]|jgi:putative aldouronate transport system permease protein|nr:carbohydrate ABC transporter permease [Treponema sp.]
MKHKPADIIIDGLILFIMGIVGIMAVLPFVYVVVASLTPPELMGRGQMILIPKRLSFEAYRYVFSTKTLMQALRVSVLLTAVGTTFNIMMTVLFAYPLAHSGIKGRRIILFLVTFTMMFSGGIVPEYMIVRSLGLMNKMSALILPGAISTFNFVIFRNYFQELPKELEESAMLDGAGYLYILMRIILPISMPIIATFVVIYGVGIWNSWFAATLYLRDSTKWPIQVVLRMLTNLSMALGDTTAMDSDIMLPPVSTKMCTIVIATVPILAVYPFMQKYFTKGILLGSVKG